MLSFDDPRWAELKGGYRVKYDPRPALQALESGQVAAAWQELWNELHHQGDVGESSYAAVPHLVRIGGRVCPDDWNLYSIIAVIEECRAETDNPPLPDWIADSYFRALNEIERLALSKMADANDGTLVSCLFEV